MHELRPLAGILLGLTLGCGLYALFRSTAPTQLAFGTAMVGVAAGGGGRLVGALGTPFQLRFLIFGTLFATLLTEFVVFRGSNASTSEPDAFVAHLTADPILLVFNILFLGSGIFLGVRWLLGGTLLYDRGED